jgi:energy-coupling factor transporter ATP-binding protein EcfA2
MIDLQDVNVGNPFPGLRPFETDEYHLFFGREGQSDELIKRLNVTRFLAVVGTSGSGKSSLIRAGLLPALHGGLMPGAGSSWRVALIRPGHDPIGNLAHELGAILDDGHTDNEIQDNLIETTLRRSTLGLVDAVRQARMSPHEKLLVVVDQFEELFRFKEARKETDSEDDALGFVKLLIEASAQVEVPIYVVLTMRSDFLGDCSQFAGLPEAINQGQYLIPRMSRDERRAAITGPVAVGGGEMTVPLINRLLNDVGDNPDQLPILQHALMRTWDYSVAQRRNGEAVGLDHYEAIGTMAEALSRHADEAFNELPSERSRLVAEKIFKALTEQSAADRETRRPVPLHHLCSIAGATEPEVVAVIETFRREGRSFLMPPAGTPLERDTIIDISHESLIRNWERLHEWAIEEAQSARIYRRLAEAAVLYHRGEEGLWGGPFLQIALEWRDKTQPNAAWGSRYHPEFTTAIAYLEDSLFEREKAIAIGERLRKEDIERERRDREQAEIYAAGQARAARRLRRYLYAMVLISLLALSGAGAAVFAFTLARKNETRAQNLADQLGRSLNAETIAKQDAERQRGEAVMAQQDAERAQLAAETAQKKAETERERADDAARLAAQHAEDERRAKEKLVAALDTAVKIRDASRFFRTALADFGRADLEDDKRNNSYARLEESIARFEKVQDYDGVAATYFTLGKLEGATPEGLSYEERRLKFWPKAVEYYRKSGNHTEAGETLEAVADVYAGQISYASDDNAKERALRNAAGFYEEAYKEFSIKPENWAGMIAAKDRLAKLYDGHDKKMAIEQLEQALALQMSHPQSSLGEHQARLTSLYRETETPERANAMIDKLVGAARARRDVKSEANFLRYLLSNPYEQPRYDYFERARQIYRQLAGGLLKYDEVDLLMTMARSLQRFEEAKAAQGKPASPENREKALEYYAAAIKYHEEEKSNFAAQVSMWMRIAELHEMAGRSQQAVDAYSRALVIEEKWNTLREDQWESLSQRIIKLRIAVNQLPQALELARQILEYYKKYNSKDKAEETQKMIDDINEKIRHQKPAPSPE